MTTTTTRKRKADVIGRQECSDSSGRGVSSGWTTCPLCASVSSKKYALGRGIASHLQAVHAPWKVSKIDRKIQRREMERKQAEAKKFGMPLPIMAEGVATNCTPWEPTEDEEIAWAQRVLELVAELEQKPLIKAGVDRTGKKAKTYRESLPDVIQAAADGTLAKLQCLFQSVGDEPDAIRGLLNTKDRNGSTAEHWAAGEGNLDCFKYLIQIRKDLPPEPTMNDATKERKVRRRDGKTSMHYAARNGRLQIIKFLAYTERCTAAIDEPSGDGTTPLHLALYGGHIETVQWLIQNGANPLATNEWQCGSAHWIFMTKSVDCNVTRALCNLLLDVGVRFDVAQKQGHFPLHKACQRINKHVIEWMSGTKEQGGAGFSRELLQKVGQPDNGGHKPSEIWRSVGGDDDFAKWMETTYGW